VPGVLSSPIRDLEPSDLTIIASRADGIDMRTVDRYLRGEQVQRHKRALIERALRELGLDPFIRGAPTPRSNGVVAGRLFPPADAPEVCAAPAPRLFPPGAPWPAINGAPPRPKTDGGSATSSPIIGPREVCRLAYEADVDHRTVEAFLRGAPTQRRSPSRARIEAAMRRLGFADSIPK
jgi:hypothetical protein